MKKIFTIIFCLLLSSSVRALPLNLDEFKQPDSEKAVSFTKYTSILNCEAKTPSYVYYNLMPKDFAGDKKRKEWWDKDLPKDIKAVCGEDYAINANYKHAGYSKGHLDPSDNYDSSIKNMKETFSFANVAPQEQKFNGGLWKQIENKERDLSVEQGGVTVITGVVHTGSTDKIKNDISVPVYFYKIILWKDKAGNIHNISWLAKNDKPDKGLKPNDVEVDIETIENISGLDFL